MLGTKSCAAVHVQLYSFTGFSASGRLPAGVYSQVAAGYTGGTANGVTFTPVSSRTQGLPDVSFTVAPVRFTYFIAEDLGFGQTSHCREIKIHDLWDL